MDQSIKKRTIWPPLEDKNPRPEPFQHFKTPEDLEQYQKDVKEAQEIHNAPF